MAQERVNLRSNKHSSESGFSLLEMLVVLTIIGLLTSLVAPRVTKYLSGAKTNTAEAQMASIAQAIALYRLEVGSAPAEQAGLSALLTAPANRPRWNGPYLERASAIIDPWGNPYLYRVPGQSGDYDLLSLGADGVEGGTGEAADVWYN